MSSVPNQPFHLKYRPQTFNEVLGQAAVVRSLKHIVQSRRAHAFLFIGPPGTGKTTLARILARDVSNDTTGNSNLIEYDGASKSGADEIRALTASLAFRSIGASPVKFVIIDEAHRLSAAAWTILLKPVEEPPPHVYYAFCSTEIGKIPKAIITRCQRYDLKPVKEELILGLLVDVVDREKLVIGDNILECVAEESMGSPRQALVYLEAVLACKSLAEARNVLRTARGSLEVIDMARWLVSGKARNWPEAMKYVVALEGQDAESCRIVLMNYFAAVAIKAKNPLHVLSLIEAFKTPYVASDKLAPLIYSLGLALKLDS